MLLKKTLVADVRRTLLLVEPGVRTRFHSSDQSGYADDVNGMVILEEEGGG